MVPPPPARFSTTAVCLSRACSPVAISRATLQPPAWLSLGARLAPDGAVWVLLAQGEAPPLFVVGPDGKAALINYRVRGTTYIVDRLFAAAELRLGTAPQRVVRIVRTDAVWREVRP